MSLARAGPPPSFLRIMRFAPSECTRRAISLMLRMMFVTSSRTPGIEENSCRTPSICTVLIAAPCSDDSNTRRSALPSVMPKPRSNGSATTVASFSRSRPGVTSSLVGLIKSCQFFCSTFTTGILAYRVVCIISIRRRISGVPDHHNWRSQSRGWQCQMPATRHIIRAGAYAVDNRYAEWESRHEWP